MSCITIGGRSGRTTYSTYQGKTTSGDGMASPVGTHAGVVSISPDRQQPEEYIFPSLPDVGERTTEALDTLAHYRKAPP